MVNSQAEYNEQNSNTKQKRFRRKSSLFFNSYFGLNKTMFFEIVIVLYLFVLSEKSSFWKTAIIHFVGGREGGSNYVDIIIREVLLNDDAWLQKGEEDEKSREKWLRNMWMLPYLIYKVTYFLIYFKSEPKNQRVNITLSLYVTEEYLSIKR